MKRAVILFVIVILCLLSANATAGDADKMFIHHELTAKIQPDRKWMEVTDIITFPPEMKAVEHHFLLHDGLTVKLESGGNLKEVDRPASGSDFGLPDENFDMSAAVPLKHYVVVSESGAENDKLILKYEGSIYHPVEQLSEEYARSFSVSPGIISSEGVVLDGASFWVPWFNDDLMTFQLDTKTPADWHSVSQGELISDKKTENGREIRWRCDKPMDCVYLIAAPFNIYEKKVGDVRLMAYLRTPDDNLAAKYLDTTSQYMTMYSTLIGPYPYSKFALVENFWETGYGMPSFTLLGPQIIRFPFILHSSYPHELLHNWWGNSVFVDYESGNWCEGLTVYLADHLIKEQHDRGVEYRRDSLRRYLDYVNKNNDFPLREFRARYHAASEAVGYGKGMMLFHMLRVMIGDEAFLKGIQRFYRDNAFHVVGYDAIQKAFENVTGLELGWFFDQWVDRTGAPRLQVENTDVSREGESWRIQFRLKQLQPGPAYKLYIPVALVTAAGGTADFTQVVMDKKDQVFELTVETKPVMLAVDPQFDVFRKLDREEIPPALSEIFGSEKVMIILPSDESPELLAGYRKLADTWSKGSKRHFEVKLDSEVEALPSDAAVWVFGRKNRFLPMVVDGVKPFDAEISDTSVRFDKAVFDFKGKSIVAVCRHPSNEDTVVVWLTTENPEALEGLRRKLPHYGKYSYLVFEGSEPSNIAKGQWQAFRSPMRVIFDRKALQPGEMPSLSLPKRPALAYLAPVFSEKRMMEHIKTLSSEEFEGRGFGSGGLEKAAQYIARRFEEYGLKPGGDDGTYFQSWKDRGGPENTWATMKNVIALIPGTDPGMAGESILVTAHYDHLGRGWPDVHTGDEGKIHPGADDNASGIAVMLELARNLSGHIKPKRTIVFVAFTGEECGRRGSRHYIDVETSFPPDKIIGVINLDTVGRLFDKKIMILGASSAREWPHIFMGCGFVSGAESEIVTQPLDSSDQVSFIEKGIPAVQVFSGPHRDYHRPTDTIDKIDPAGLVKIAAFVKEAVLYLAERKEPLTPPSGKASAGDSVSHPSGEKNTRRVTTGAMPDFAFSGTGVKLADVPPESPAGKAGLKAGDIIVAIDGKRITSLKEYADELRKHAPGDVVRVDYQRGEQEFEASVSLKER